MTHYSSFQNLESLPDETLVSAWLSPDKSKVAFYWVSGNYVRLISVLDLRTKQKQSMTFNVTDNEIIFDGWSADNKYLAVDERRDSGAEILTVFDAATMQRVVTQQSPGAVW